ncbi:MAG: hypothetical protein OEM02_07935 [Desulfobulbaceae bacterium]|nr:hypothetical protein [Desulfobulbaceae bacterium]
MKLRSAKDIRTKFYEGKWRCHREIKLAQEQLGDEIIFEALYGVFIDPDIDEEQFEIQHQAGHCLLKLLPKCKGNLVELIKDSLLVWNRSVEELPWYFFKQFGKKDILVAIEEIEHNYKLKDSENKKLRTYKYWLCADDEYLNSTIEAKYKI